MLTEWILALSLAAASGCAGPRAAGKIETGMQSIEVAAPKAPQEQGPEKQAPAPSSVEPSAKPQPAPSPAEKAPAAIPKEPPRTEATAPAAPASEVRELVERMQAFYEKTQDFTASFKQDYTYKAFRRTQTSSGTVTFKKPALMRWEYEKPSPKTFVLAGERVYAYDPEAMTLTKASISTSQLSASVTFLWGKGNLLDEFSISRADCKKCQGVLLELVPKRPDPRFQKVLLEVDPKSARVLVSTVIDPDGSQNAIAFLELKTNVGVNESHFKLSPPAGTQIQDFTQETK